MYSTLSVRETMIFVGQYKIVYRVIKHMAHAADCKKHSCQMYFYRVRYCKSAIDFIDSIDVVVRTA